MWYDFEDDDIETGPYTVMIFDGSRGSVSLSGSYRYSGYRSVEIRDVASDGQFSELQGFFADKWHGRLYIHFALLVAEPEESMNVAFAGHAHFSMVEHGIGIWLQLRGGNFYQVTGGKRDWLFEVAPFTWYVFDIAYDVDRGTYDLQIAAEGLEEPVVARSGQTNAVGIPGS